MALTAKPLSALGLTARPGSDVAVTGLSVDSRLVKPGHLFAALPGTRVHGATFVTAALERGAGAVLTDRAGEDTARQALAGGTVPLLVVEDARLALSCAAALFFGAQPATMVAVTGTNGKTSVATFTRMIWQALGLDAANIGTTGVEGAFAAPSSHTTPEPITLHRLLAEMAAAGVTHAAMEASSHGLAQRRLDGVMLKAAAFTNFTQDHLDYHATFDEYFDAKAGLFSRVLPEEGTAVINTDDPKGAVLVERARARGQKLIRVGQGDTCEIQLQGQRFDAAGQDVRFLWQGGPQMVRLPLIGGFQAMNVLTAAGLVIACGAEPKAVFEVLPQLATVRGRMQLAATRTNGATVFVDYAHTPDAVETALRALRPHVLGRIIAIVGAGGDRDRTKRPLMGAAAAAHADAVIVTDDNPRTEDPALIRAAVMAGAGPEATEVGDRAEAILRGVDALGPGDALLIMGKGHERGQVIGTDVFPFDDAEQASIAVAALDGKI
ncbi:UDP-N-acetylmuramoyl-L-alanyl-D-glutamate--2,6-diaminopimelate ligase [Rhodobacter capsulatus]|uniref:UDP-N-acetylmuramoyl-L-alanyl-D-glutamate--2,6-diaminopimelate ligase n=1 Tax=Rhodobacter capsulatus (strain ATCC BAA-309 / NBRC 16581 / SB1003) TaxID=272942 RepID=D5ATB9_RHOCB|nr:UDP-N-acetylmuramoyl-L-alanyl-D-glutamate--2,6-diaminopimelate ligase [Rhodobacter capsulatus]ADE85226.1 UDP-N-acetylmuramoyl-L-alanyl-D-glutamate--2,6-diaminopimelate ligase [Rhodobacter capsulatus SB 1003]ETD01954.1 UDP-N-acetylmuramoylalanyl-D-glutamate--2,6-diaminopimelate ligase [Rhodobacter capsulatus DE442]ETD77373.1 UDP-N-acetylmuramoylalanyl-D-glutamate--2,6-diaminopimelate ligase [Rhodobacter capsulatus R121]ETD84864.1 UDP-N-acetylmuramoylalanyl-D-glutamate--2,6-diaminopimelate lig